MEDEVQIPDGREFGVQLVGDAIFFGLSSGQKSW
jgi:hypothetical protein